MVERRVQVLEEREQEGTFGYLGFRESAAAVGRVACNLARRVGNILWHDSALHGPT